MTRNPSRRKYRPVFEALERKQLLSTGVSTYGAALVQPTARMTTRAVSVLTYRLGTGKGGIIITS